MASASKTLLFRNEPVSIPESSRNIEKQLWSNQQIRSLIFDEYSLLPTQTIATQGLVLPNLTNLMITLRSVKSQSPRDILSQLSRIKLPRVSSLRLDSLYLVKDEIENSQMYLALFEYLCQHASTIQVLTLKHMFKPRTAAALENEPLQGNSSLGHEQLRDNLKLALNNLELTELTIFLDEYEASKGFQLGLHILGTQAHLTKLQVQLSDGQDTALFYRAIQGAIDNNQDTLRHLCITRNLINSPIEDLQDIFKSLGKCPNLESLRLFLFTILTFPHPLPPSLRFLDLMGKLHPSILVEIKNNSPCIEQLHFANLSTEFSTMEEQNELVTACKSLTKMGRLRLVRWHFPKFNMDFLRQWPGVEVKTSPTNAFASLIYFHKDWYY